jgi:hypothetical protein
MLDKYQFPNKNITFIEKKTGAYCVFRTPENKIYLITNETFHEKFIGPRIPANFDLNNLIVDDIFTIDNKDFSGILQYKKRLYGEYYVMETNGQTIYIIGADIDSLDNDEQKRLLVK